MTHGFFLCVCVSLENCNQLFWVYSWWVYANVGKHQHPKGFTVISDNPPWCYLGLSFFFFISHCWHQARYLMKTVFMHSLLHYLCILFCWGIILGILWGDYFDISISRKGGESMIQKKLLIVRLLSSTESVLQLGFSFNLSKILSNPVGYFIQLWHLRIWKNKQHEHENLAVLCTNVSWNCIASLQLNDG